MKRLDEMKGTMSILHEAIEKEWYEKGKEDIMLLRRLTEYNICFRGNYSFYNDTQLEELKKITGFSN